MKATRAVALACALVAVFVLPAESRNSAVVRDPLPQGGEARVPAPSTRRAPDAPPVPPPALPAGAGRVLPLTITISIRHEPGSGPVPSVQQTITRTVDRIHIAAGSSREWLFERNPRDFRRVSGSLIDHESRTIIRYEDSDLRMELGLRGWLDVLTLGFDPDLLNTGTRTSDVLATGGIPFARYSLGQGSSRSRDVWWNEEQVLPSRFMKADRSGVTHFSIERITPGADAALLNLPGARFPTYRAIDLANWLERH